MDWILLGFCFVYFVVGIKRGFVSTIFSLLSTIFVLLLSFRFCGALARGFENFFQESLEGVLKNGINNFIPGEFENANALLFCLVATKYGKFFMPVLKILLKNIHFEGTLSAGEIMSPVLARLILKVIAFIVLFIILSLTFKILERILNKLCKMLKWKENRLIGGFLGISKGFVVFMVCFVIVAAIANFTLSEPLIKFVQSGAITRQIYNNLTIKIINLFS